MRIKKVHIDGFGKWHDQDFFFDNNPVLIYGQNEAGKTTLASFILSVLFGFADSRGKNKYQQYLPKSGSSYGGSLLVEENNHQYIISREKGKNGGKVTIVDEEGHKKKAAFLSKLLGPMDRDLYQSIYSFNQQNILNDDLNSEQLENQWQRLGAVSGREWLLQISKLEKAADSIYKPRGRKTSLNQHLKEYDELRKQVNASQEQSKDYEELLQKKHGLQEKIGRLKEELPSLKERVINLEHLQRLWPIYIQWKDQQSQQTNVAEVSDQQVVRIQELQTQERELNSQLSSLNRQAAEQEASLNQIKTDDLAHYQQDKLHYQQIKDKLLGIQVRQNSYQTQSTDQWRNELKNLEERYGHSPLPKPLSDRSIEELNGLLNANRSSQPRNQSLFLPGIGLMALIIGLIINQPLVWLLGLIALGGAVAVWYRERQQANQDKQQEENLLNNFGTKHNLSPYPIKEWLLMQTDLHRYQDLSKQLEEAEQKKDELAKEFTRLKQEIPFTLNNDEDISSVVTSYTRWMLDIQDQNQRYQNVQQNLQNTKHHQEELAKQVAVIKQKLQHNYQKLGISSNGEFSRLLTDRQVAKTKEVTNNVYEKQLPVEVRQKLAVYAGKEELDNNILSAHQNVAANQQEETSLNTDLEKINIQINHLVNEGTFSRLNQELQNLQAIILEESKEWLSLQLTISWINSALRYASQDRFPLIIKQAEKYFAILTNNHYQKIIVESDHISALDDQQQLFQVEELSLGTAEQLFVSLRLGFITVISGQIHLPIMVDDGFVNFDNIRREKVLKLLDQMAINDQVIYFTADDRIKDLNLNVIDLSKLK
ncbi:AAA family ATPase [Lactobacillaceae bacterium 24-114]